MNSVLSVINCVLLPHTALRDHRIELVRASWQELTIRIGDVSLSDEGQYTCSLFTMPVKTTKAFLTVLGELVCPHLYRPVAELLWNSLNVLTG